MKVHQFRSSAFFLQNEKKIHGGGPQLSPNCIKFQSLITLFTKL